MKTTNYKIAALKAGQEVAIANCSGIFRVIERVANGMYKVDFRGRVVVVPRSQLAVNVLGQWKHGPHNATMNTT